MYHIVVEGSLVMLVVGIIFYKNTKGDEDCKVESTFRTAFLLCDKCRSDEVVII